MNQILAQPALLTITSGWQACPRCRSVSVPRPPGRPGPSAGTSGTGRTSIPGSPGPAKSPMCGAARILHDPGLTLPAVGASPRSRRRTRCSSLTRAPLSTPTPCRPFGSAEAAEPAWSPTGTGSRWNPETSSSRPAGAGTTASTPYGGPGQRFRLRRPRRPLRHQPSAQRTRPGCLPGHPSGGHSCNPEADPYTPAHLPCPLITWGVPRTCG
jgi:hypothetical protein